MYWVIFFKQKTAYEMLISDWSSDVCSSDLLHPLHRLRLARRPARVERARRRGGDDAGSGAAADARHRDRDLLPLDDARRPRARTLYGGPGVGDDAQPVDRRAVHTGDRAFRPDRADHRLSQRPRRRSEEHTSELQSLMRISYAVFCLKKKKHTTKI